MKLITKEIKIGFVAIIALILIYLGMMFLKGLKLFNSDTNYLVKMNDVSGLTVGGQVLANGMQVGLIDAIDYNPEQQDLLVTISVKPEFKIPEGTTVFTTKEMLGSPRMNLRLGPSDAPSLKAGDIMFGSTGGDIMSTVGDMMPQLQALIPKLDSILGAVNTLVNQPALNASVQNLEDITNNLKNTTVSINKLMNQQVPVIVNKANTSLDNVELLTNKLNAVDIEGISTNINKTLSNATSITEYLNTQMHSQNSSLGMLLNDNTIALRVDSTVVNASLLLEDIRLHPKRYVHFSVFGKKDK